MKLLGWVILIALIAAVGLFALLRWSPASLPPELVEQLPAALIDAVSTADAPTAAGAVESAGSGVEGPTIYAWKDDQGRWNYTDQPPTDRPYETRQYRQDVNVVPDYQRETDDGS